MNTGIRFKVIAMARSTYIKELRVSLVHRKKTKSTIIIFILLNGKRIVSQKVFLVKIFGIKQ